MSRATLYITEQQAIIRKTSDRLVVEKDGEVLQEIPCIKLHTVALFGNVQFTTQAAAKLLDRGIELALFTRSGRLRGQLTPPHPKNVLLRVRQHRRLRDDAFRLRVARAIVEAKIANAASFWRRYRGNHRDAVSLGAIRELDSSAAQARDAVSLEALRGVEGAAASFYFSHFGGLVSEPFTFEGRNKRPPRDPVNALLSFGYVLVATELQALLDGIGFDPYIGVLHEVRYGRASLALDLLEELRAPLVDRMTLRMLNTRVLGPHSFYEHPRRGVRLTREGLKRYFRAYEAALGEAISVDGSKLSYRQVFRRQAHRLAKAMEGEDYRSFRMPP